MTRGTCVSTLPGSWKNATPVFLPLHFCVQMNQETAKCVQIIHCYVYHEEECLMFREDKTQRITNYRQVSSSTTLDEDV